MIEIEMSKDFREFEPKVIEIFTVRQIACMGIAAVVAVPVIMALPFDLYLRILIGLFAAAPIIVCGFFDLYGMHPEVYLTKVIIPYYLYPRKRKYVTQNTMDYIRIKKEEPKNQKKKVRYTRELRPRR